MFPDCHHVQLHRVCSAPLKDAVRSWGSQWSLRDVHTSYPVTCVPQITSFSQTQHLAPWHPETGCGVAPSSTAVRTPPSLRNGTSSTSPSWAR